MSEDFDPKLFIDGYVAPSVTGLYHVNLGGPWTAAEILDADNPPNSAGSGKYTGAKIWDSDNERVMVAQGPDPTDQWCSANSGQSVCVTPVTGNFSLSAVVGAFILTGQDASLLADLVAVAAAGTFTMTGQDATLTFAGGSPSPSPGFTPSLDFSDARNSMYLPVI